MGRHVERVVLGFMVLVVAAGVGAFLVLAHKWAQGML